MYEYDGTKQLTGLARSIDALFSEPRPASPPPGMAEAEPPAEAAPPAEEPAAAEPSPPPLPEGDAPVPPPLPAGMATPPPVPLEAESPPPLPEPEASPPPLPEPDAPAAAEPAAAAAAEPDASLLPEPDPVPPAEPDPSPTPEPAVVAAPEGESPGAPPPAAPAPEGELEELTELDVAVDAYLGGDHGRGPEIERLAGEHVDSGELGSVARSVGRIAAAAGEPPDAEMLALAQAISSPVVLGRLARQMGGERQAEKRDEYFRACRVLGLDMARAIRDDLAENSDTLARSVHCEALTRMGSAGREVVEEMVGDDIWFLARNGVAILGDLGGDGAVELVRGALANPDARVRREALRSLAKLGAEDAGELVTALLDDTDEGVQMAAAVAAGELGVQRAVRPLVRMLDEAKDPDRIVSIVRALGQLGDPGAVPAIEKHAVPSLFSKPRTNVRVAAYRALYHIGTPHAMKLLAKASSDKDPEVQSAVLGLRKSVGREG